MKARPKSYVMYRIVSFLGEAECYIHCYPQQKWDANIRDNEHVELSRNNIDFIIPKEDFDKQWTRYDLTR